MVFMHIRGKFPLLYWTNSPILGDFPANIVHIRTFRI